MKKGLLIVNLGTPDAPSTSAVRRYLTEFLNDPYVIDIPQPFRFLLVNGIIIPFRVRKSTNLYRRLWTPEGSPILHHLIGLRLKLANRLPEHTVYAAMRYGSPSLKKVMEKIHVDGITHLTVLPLYPQFADSTTETIINRIREIAFAMTVIQDVRRNPEPGSSMTGIQDIRFIRQFYHHPAFIRAFVERMKPYNPSGFDHVIFTFHSLPESHLQRIHPEHPCTGCACETAMPEYGRECYKAAAYETSRRLASAFQLSTTDYSVSFQSRFANKWIGPFTDERIRELAAKGVKRILVVAPSFVADCLETIVEISLDYRELFLREGGNELVMAESLNDEDFWATAIVEIIR